MGAEAWRVHCARDAGAEPAVYYCLITFKHDTGVFHCFCIFNIMPFHFCAIVHAKNVQNDGQTNIKVV